MRRPHILIALLLVAGSMGCGRSPKITGLGPGWIETSHPLVALVVSGTNLFAAVAGLGVFRSTDNGTNWTPVNNGLTARSVFVLGGSGTSVFLGTYGLEGNAWTSHVYRSADNGASWTAADNVPLGAMILSGTSLFAGTAVTGVYRSTDDGVNWTPFNAGFPPLVSITALAVRGTSLFADTSGYDSSQQRVRAGIWRRSL